MNSGKPHPDPAARSLARGVLRLARRLRVEHGDAGGLSGLSLLAAVNRCGPATPSQLAREEGLQPQSLTRLLVTLEERGLIARQRDAADGRRILVRITPAGRRALAAEMGRMWDWLAEAMGQALDEDEREVLGRSGALMERLAAL